MRLRSMPVALRAAWRSPKRGGASSWSIRAAATASESPLSRRASCIWEVGDAMTATEAVEYG